MKTLAALMPTQSILESAAREANALTTRWDVPTQIDGQPVPPDLRDRIGRFHKTSDGFRITGRLLMSDVLIGSESPVVSVLIGLLPILYALLLLVPFVVLVHIAPSLVVPWIWANYALAIAGLILILNTGAPGAFAHALFGLALVNAAFAAPPSLLSLSLSPTALLHALPYLILAFATVALSLARRKTS